MKIPSSLFALAGAPGLAIRVLMLALLWCGSGGGSFAAEENGKKLNVLFIAVDDLRPDLGCYGKAGIRSPNVDKLAGRGMVFERAYCQQAVCNPSRCSVLSGSRPDTTRCVANNTFLRPMMPEVVTLPQHFKNHGWQALSLGKVFHHSEKEPGDDPQSWSEPSWYHSESYRSWFTKESEELMKGLKKLPEKERPKIVRGPPFEAADQPDEVYPDGQTAGKAMETLQRLKSKGEPFFLGVGFVKPHLPFTCPQKYWDLYPAETVKLPDNYFPPKNVPAPALHNWYELRTYGGVPAEGGIPDEMALKLIRGYKACTTFVDAQIGRVLDELDRLGLRESTIVVLWGDHGYHLGENGIFTKMTNFELGTHVPLIVSAPGMKTAGQRTRALVELVDLYPTLAELAGLPRPAHLEGTSLAPLLEKPERGWKPAVFSQYLRPGKDKVEGRSVRTERWRYTEWMDAKGASAGVELYDEQEDPKENVNVAGEPGKAETVRVLAKQLHEGWRAAVPVEEGTAAVGAGGASAGAEVVLGSFEEKTWGGWTAEGAAFGAGPFEPGTSGRVTAWEGAGVAWSGRGGFASKGTLLSPEFSIKGKYLNYLIGGTREVPAVLGAELLVDGRVVRAGSASEDKDLSHSLYWRTWDVAELVGRRARIRVNDGSATGAVAVDQFMQSDEAKGVPADATTLGAESHRPQFHYTALTGWLNDANGLLNYRGQWHLFHQHRPAASKTIVWGHAVSGDLLHWERLPVGVTAGGGDSAASGSGLVDAENVSGLKRGENAPLLFFYTNSPSDGSLKKTQCLAYSTDGARTFEQFPGNPILRTPATHDRDPKVFYYQPTRTWIMALSLSRNNTDREHATYGLFRSKDLKSWELFQELGPGAWYWECPDMFELPVDGDAARTKWIFMKGSGDYILGTFDGERFVPEAGPIRTHWGGSFYGAQTFADAPGGRRVQIGWMSTGKAGPNSWPGMPFNQQMSFPRELTLRTTAEGPRVFREPIAEMAQLYTKTHEIKPGMLEPGVNALAGVHEELLDLEVEIELQAASQVKLVLRGQEVVYDTKERKLKAFGRAVTLLPVEGKLVLRVILDRTSLELFGNHGEVTLSGIFFTDPKNQELSLQVEGGPVEIRRLSVREVKPIWEAAAR